MSPLGCLAHNAHTSSTDASSENCRNFTSPPAVNGRATPATAVALSAHLHASGPKWLHCGRKFDIGPNERLFSWDGIWRMRERQAAQLSGCTLGGVFQVVLIPHGAFENDFEKYL